MQSVWRHIALCEFGDYAGIDVLSSLKVKFTHYLANSSCANLGSRSRSPVSCLSLSSKLVGTNRWSWEGA